jgi:pimeloyl-ACP methyl ester carboxylesterase
MWQSQIQALKQGYRVVAYDLRGQGRTETGDGQFTVEFLVDDLIALLDALKINCAVLCGLSMGGYVALRTAERHRDRVDGLVLCDTKSEADTNEGKLARAGSIKAIKEDGVREFAKSFLCGALSPSGLSNRNLVSVAMKIISRNQPLGLCGTLLALACRTDTSGFLPTIKVPTLIVVGEADKITPVECSSRMHSAIQGSELQLIHDAGHFSNMENSIQFNEKLADFLTDRIKA